MSKLIEQFLPVVAEAGLNTNKNVVLGGTANLTVAGNLVVTGTISGGAEATTSQVITSASANAFAVGPTGSTNAAFNVDASAATPATGLNLKIGADGAGLQLKAVSSGTNSDLYIDSQAAGGILFNRKNNNSSTTIGFQGQNANTLFVSTTGSTSNPVFNVDASTASAVAGLNIKGAATGGTVVVSAIDTGSNTSLSIASKGTGTILLSNGSAGASAGGAVQVQSVLGSNAFAVGNSGFFSFNVDNSTSSSATGLNVKTAAAGSGLAVSVISSGAAENLTIAAKGTTGTVTFNPAIVAAAGGAVTSGIQYGSINVGLYTGTGAPTFSAMNGSIYTDSNATTTTTRIYVNKSGAGTAGTTWTALTTAA